MSYHCIVVGAGTAGCVAAARLSADIGRRVLLLEAGPDYEPVATPTSLLDSERIPFDHDWGLRSAKCGREPIVDLLRGKVVGGSSATNVAYAVRALPSDFERWTATGVEGWTFDDVLPVYKAMEDDPAGDPRWHGRGGPIPIRRIPISDMTRFQRHFIDAAVAAGLPRVEDFNAPKNTTGAGPAPRNVLNGVRQSMALTHLAAARTRRNLEVRTGVLVDKILISSGTARGVRLADGTEIRSPEIVLCAGSYESPAILMRSGIGPATELTRHGIGVVADLPVGSTLTEHPFFTMLISADPAKLGATLPAFGVTVTARSARSADPDLHILPSTFIAPGVTATGAAFAVQVGMVRPTSRGRVRLRSQSPNERPQVTPALLRTDDDLDRTLQGIAIARNILAEAPLSHLIVDHLNPPADMVGDELTAHLRANVGSYCHPVATAVMGPQGGTHSVVDGQGRVWGLDGIYLADASIIPVIPSVAINITVAMVAERISSWIAETSGPLRAAG